jgi:hypothetical protein
LRKLKITNPLTIAKPDKGEQVAQWLAQPGCGLQTEGAKPGMVNFTKQETVIWKHAQ